MFPITYPNCGWLTKHLYPEPFVFLDDTLLKRSSYVPNIEKYQLIWPNNSRGKLVYLENFSFIHPLLCSLPMPSEVFTEKFWLQTYYIHRMVLVQYSLIVEKRYVISDRPSPIVLSTTYVTIRFFLVQGKQGACWARQQSS